VTKNLFLGACACGLLCAAACAQQDTVIREIPLGDRVLVLQHGFWAETLTVLDAGAGLVVVDTGSSPRAAMQAKDIMDRRFHKPVTHVINTHYHWDHTFGNQVFADAVIVGHRSCVADMNAAYATAEARSQALDKAMEGSPELLKEFIRGLKGQVGDDFRLTVPTHLVDDREVLQVGDLSIGLYHVPGLHTGSNLTVYVPELGLLFTRREFQRGSLPVLEPGIDMAKLIASLDAVRASGRPVRYLVPGHGDPVENPDLGVAMAYVRTLAEAVQSAKQEGRTLDQVLEDPRFQAISEAALNPKVHLANLDLVWQAAQASAK
jgi:glyoxylase-like metal-dependent hydrolase (beta-lactamase superfamily II)